MQNDPLLKDPKQSRCASTRRQREAAGRAPHPTADLVSAKRPRRASIFFTAFPPRSHGPAGIAQGTGSTGPKIRAGRGRARGAPAGGHMPLPARGGTTLSRLRRNAGKGGRALTLAHTHTPGRAAPPARTRLPPPARRRAPNAQAQRPRAARGPAARRMAPNCHPPAQPGHSLPRRHTPLVSPHAPFLASHFPPTPNWIPAHSPSGSLSRRKVPRIGKGNHRIQ